MTDHVELNGVQLLQLQAIRHHYWVQAYHLRMASESESEASLDMHLFIAESIDFRRRKMASEFVFSGFQPKLPWFFGRKAANKKRWETLCVIGKALGEMKPLPSPMKYRKSKTLL